MKKTPILILIAGFGGILLYWANRERLNPRHSSEPDKVAEHFNHQEPSPAGNELRRELSTNRPHDAGVQEAVPLPHPSTQGMRAVFQDDKSRFLESVRAMDALQGRHQDVVQRELQLRQSSGLLRENMNRHEVMALLGSPIETNKTIQVIGDTARIPDGPYRAALHLDLSAMVYSPHTDRAHHVIGDSFQVLEVWFDKNGKLREWDWKYPPMD